MAKRATRKTDRLTEDEQVEVATLEAAVVAEEAAEPTVDERVAAVFAEPEPGQPKAGAMGQFVPAPVVEPEPVKEPSVCEQWHAEAAEILALSSAGNAVSPSRIVSALSRAVGLVPRA